MRTIRATLPNADLQRIEAMPGVTAADTRGESVLITCSDSDIALRAFLPAFPAASDIEVTGAGLEEAFLQLTRDNVEDSA
jgi:ABC-2 type transport system ATP-binding protein